jgi:hypothetical protein
MEDKRILELLPYMEVGVQATERSTAVTSSIKNIHIHTYTRN